jgi:hypothetical protein
VVIHSYTLRCSTALFLYCARSVGWGSAPGTPPTHRNCITTRCPSLGRTKSGTAMLTTQLDRQGRKRFSLFPARKINSAAKTIGFKTNHCRNILTELRVKNLIGIVEDRVHLGPLGTGGTNRPIVPTRGDYDDGEIGGMMIGKGNLSTRRKPASVSLCPPQTPTFLAGREPGPPRWEAND